MTGLALEILAEAFAIVLLIGLAILLNMVLTAIAGVLTSLRRSLRGTLIGLGIGLLLVLPLTTVTDDLLMGLIGGAIGFVIAFFAYVRLRSPEDPVRRLHHQAVTGIIVFASLGALASIGIVWILFIGYGGLSTVTMMVANPIGTIVLLAFTVLPGLLAVSAYRRRNG